MVLTTAATSATVGYLDPLPTSTESAQVTPSTARLNPTTPGPARRMLVARRWLRLATVSLASATAVSVLALGSPGPVTAVGPVTPGAASAAASPTLRLVSAHPHRWPGHPGRRLVRYRVRPGDTATGLAVRFHAWTRELRSLNHLGSRGTLYVGEHVRVPVVLAAVPHARRHHAGHAHHARHHARRAHRAHATHGPQRTHGARHHRHALPRHPPAHHRHRHPWRQADASRATVRRVIVRTARRHDMEPASALAIAWQESGWQQHVKSSAGAVGTMQVLPGTGRWISVLVGRRLHLHHLHDNVVAGVVLYKLLRRDHSVRGALAGYYQGLGSVHANGMYKSTKRYIRNVKHLKRALDHGWRPLH